MNMLTTLWGKVFGTKNDRFLKNYHIIMERVNAYETQISKLTDEQLCAKTDYFKQKIADGKSLDYLLPEAFACVREASKRVLGMRHFDVQLIGGMVLHDGNVAQMRTGEGKTLVSTLPAYLNALMGKGVHIVTVNDYLSQRDAQWMGKIHRFLGLSVGCIDGDLSPMQKKEAYAKDITYGTNNEFGFDYLRDNLAIHPNEIVQRKPFFAIIDEVDSILIDEARTPLIISGPSDDKSELYNICNEIATKFSKEEYDLDEESKSVTLNEKGYDTAEALLQEKSLLAVDGNLYDHRHLELIHHLNQAVRAQILFQKDRDYIIKNNKVILIDEFTGRMMDGRRYSDGLHQALEAKETVEIQPENQTLSSVTFQNYFRLYDKLSGMTGTADTEASELKESFDLEVVDIPTNLPVQRIDKEDALYIHRADKITSIIKEIVSAQKRGQPVLVGTASIEGSEELSEILKKEKIQHQVLNARYHAQEAEIISEAGRLGAVTISTNMAGRGTDIQLGGALEVRLKANLSDGMTDNQREAVTQKITKEVEAEKQKVIEAGGLYVIGTERHESRRIDNQLRGRSGRQGDKGRSRFFLSLDDDLLRIFAGGKLKSLLSAAGMENNEGLEDRMLSRAIIRAQKKIEEKNYEARRHLMRYDDIINEQRSIIFERRRRFIHGDHYNTEIKEISKRYITDVLSHFCPPKSVPDAWDQTEIIAFFADKFPHSDMEIAAYFQKDGITDEDFILFLTNKMQEMLFAKIDSWEEDLQQEVLREVILRPMDFHWRNHLTFLDRLSKVIGFRGYGQKDPLIEYKRESFESFSAFLHKWREEVLTKILRLDVEYAQSPEDINFDDPNLMVPHPTDGYMVKLRDYPRNALCLCGSGKKFKHCHGNVEAKSRNLVT